MWDRIANPRHRVSSQFHNVCCSRAISRSIWKRFAVFGTIGFAALLLYLCLTEVSSAIEGIQFIKTTCFVNRSEVTEHVPCSCGVYARTACYPCLKVLVFVDVHFNDGSAVFTIRKAAYLRESLYVLHQKCFCRPSSCCHSKDKNKNAIEAKQKMLNNHGKTFSCYYNPRDPLEVFLHRHFYELIIFNSFIWPSFGVTVSILILRYLRRLRIQEEKDKVERLLRKAREIRPSEVTGMERPGVFVEEDVWVQRKEDSRPTREL